jgi:hypothetical protein
VIDSGAKIEVGDGLEGGVDVQRGRLGRICRGFGVTYRNSEASVKQKKQQSTD